MKTTDWRVMRFNYLGFSHWQVYRLKSVCAPDQVGNREFKGGIFDTEADAQKYADLLNEIELSESFKPDGGEDE